IEKKCYRRVWRAALRMFLYKPHELVSNATKRIELERMFAGSGFEELVLALLEIDRRSTGHVVEVITLPIPRERRPHRWAIARVVKVIRAGEVLLLRESRGGVAEVRRVVIKKRAAKLARGAARESYAHSRHRHHRGGFHADQIHAPLHQRVCKGSARRRLRGNQLVPRRTGLSLKRLAPLACDRVRIKLPVRFKQLTARHRRRDLQLRGRKVPHVADTLT